MTGGAGAAPPRLTIFAGPNGSGKSTVVEAMRSDPDFPEFINADEIAVANFSHIPEQSERDRQAAVEADRRRYSALSEGRSFAFESVLSVPGRIAFIDEARAKGFVVELVFVTTGNPDLNVLRATTNAEANDRHRVDEGKVRSRYEAAMRLLPALLLRVDEAIVYDNSVPFDIGGRPIPVAVKDADGIRYPEDAPWVSERLKGPLEARQARRRAFAAVAGQAGPGNTLSDARLDGDPVYSGLIVVLSDTLVLQRLQDHPHKFIAHDVLLTNGAHLEPGKARAIPYRFGPDGKHLAAYRRPTLHLPKP